jgi:FkbM family methyltransferase
MTVRGSAAAVAVARVVPDRWLRSVNRRMYRFAWSRAVLNVIWRRVADVPVVIPRGPLAGWRFASGGARPGYLLGASEPDLQQAFARCVAPGTTVYDVGANVGFFTLLGARLAADSGHVYAFEPMPVNVRALTRNIRLNDLDHVDVVASAVSDTCDPVGMAPGEDQETGHIAAGDRPGLITVPCTTLDAFVAAGHRPPDIVKIDVEGAEDRVLSGMAGTLRAHRPIVLCELHFGPDDPRRATISGVLRDAGYAETLLELDGGSMAHLLATPAARTSPRRSDPTGR